MAVSRNTEHRNRPSFWRRLFGQLTRYDAVLTVIPLLFLAAFVGSALTPIPLLGAVGAGALLSATILVDALFFNPPVGGAS